LLVDGPAIIAVNVAGALRIIVVTVAVVVDTMTTVDFIFGVPTVVGLVTVGLHGSVTIMDFEFEVRTVDVAAIDGFDLVTSVDDVSVVLSLDDAVVVTVSSSEMTTVSWKSNRID